MYVCVCVCIMQTTKLTAILLLSYARNSVSILAIVRVNNVCIFSSSFIPQHITA